MALKLSLAGVEKGGTAKREGNGRWLRPIGATATGIDKSGKAVLPDHVQAAVSLSHNYRGRGRARARQINRAILIGAGEGGGSKVKKEAS
jgi:hypothetical protein